MRLVIVGGVAGGASAAARARRISEEAEIILFERGEHVSFANCGLAYYIGGEITQREKLLVQTPEGLKKRFKIDVRVRSEVLSIDRAKKEVQVRDHATGQIYTERYDKLILAPGAEPFRPPLPGIENPKIFVLRHLRDSDRIKAMVEAGAKCALVIGGGYIGLEVSENLRRRGLDVTLVQSHPQVMMQLDPEMAEPIHECLRAHGVHLFLDDPATSFADYDGKILCTLKSGRQIAGDFVVLGVGVRPETQLARQAGLQIGERGGIVVNDHLQTSDPDIYAVGDAIEVKDFVTGKQTIIPLGGPANRQGRIAADNALGRDVTYEGTQGTAIVRVFDLTVALTGASERALKQAGMKYEKVYVHPMNHAPYYPGATMMTIKLLFTPDVGRILGAQIVGGDGVDKRIDVLATALRAGLTVFDLEELELAYAPQYGSAKDPINIVGFAAANVLRGDVALAHAESISVPDAGPLILDVRTAAEHQAGHIPGSKHIPVDELRERLHELPKDCEILAYCAAGLRGYLACRILSQHGFKCRNLSGGYKVYSQYHPKETSAASASSPPSSTTVKEVTLNCCGMQCPGPILQVKKKMEELPIGARLRVCATDMGFAADIAAWCQSTGNRLVEVKKEGDQIVGIIEKQSSLAAQTQAPAPQGKNKTIIVFSDALDRVMAAFVIANGAAAMGYKVTMFFTFWGLNVLRRRESVPVKKYPLDHMFGWMMPRGPENLKLSKMNLGGMGTALMKRVMKQKNINSLPQLLQMARQSGIRLVACTMTMDVMGITREELIDGVEFGGVATYLNAADESNVNLFI